MHIISHIWVNMEFGAKLLTVFQKEVLNIIIMQKFGFKYHYHEEIWLHIEQLKL